MFWRLCTKVLGWVVVATQVLGAAGHGYLAEPKSRNWLHNSNYCPHCLPAGGPGVTYGSGPGAPRFWPKSLHGVCGDPYTGPLDHEAGGKFATKTITGKYKQGQTIPITIEIKAPHGGRFSFGVCPVLGATDAEERKTVTQACFDANQLTNADDGSKYWWLGKKGAGTYAMRFTLPPHIVCKRCVLQWHWESGNSCTIPGTPAEHIFSPNLVSCAQSTSMEEFWNCADITVEPASGASVAPPPRPKSRAKAAARVVRETFVTGVEMAFDWATLLATVLVAASVLLLPFAPGVATGAGLAVFVVVRRLAPSPPRK